MFIALSISVVALSSMHGFRTDSVLGTSCVGVVICLSVLSQAADCKETYRAGFELLATGKPVNYARALCIADKALSANPSDPWAIFLKAEYFRFSGKFDQALRLDDRAIECADKSRLPSSYLSRFHEYRGHTLFALKRFGECEKEARRAIELDPSTAGHFLLLGDSLRAQMRYKEAIRAYDEVDGRLKGYVPAFEGKTDCLQRLGLRFEDRDYLNAILRKDPKNQAAHYAKFLNDLASGNLLEAERELDTLISIAPGWQEHYPKLIRAYAKRHEIQRAVSLCDRYRLYNKTGVGHDLLAEILWATGRRDEAVDSCSLALGVAPKNSGFRLHRAYMLRRLGKYSDAVKDYDVLIDRDKARLESDRGFCYLCTRQYEKAIADFSTAIARLHEWKDHRDRAKCYLALKQYRKALADADKALANSPSGKMNDLRRLRYDVLFEMGKNAEALAEANKLIELQSFNPVLYRMRAAVLGKLGRESEAKADISQAARLEKDSASPGL